MFGKVSRLFDRFKPNSRRSYEDRPWQNWDQGDVSAQIDGYWRESEIEKQNRQALVEGIGRSFGTNLPIFEVGCGSGLIGEELISAGVVSPANYSGGDVSKSMLELARSRLPGCDLSELDIFNLSSVVPRDNVVCLHVLQHLPHYRDALAQLIQFSRRQLYIATWFSESGSDELSTGKDGPAEPIFNTNRYGFDSFLSAIRSSGRPIAHLSHSDLLLHTRAIHVVFA